ncbi:hypothetical protein B9N19_26285 [Escherichia coli]|nr:hypothetical protein B9N19_26285 [Escherichia coli]
MVPGLNRLRPRSVSGPAIVMTVAVVVALCTFIRKRLARTVLIFTERSTQLSRATDRVPGLPASPGYAQ